MLHEKPPLAPPRKRRRRRLSVAKAEKIRALARSGVSHAELARRYGANLTEINLIIINLIWRREGAAP